MVSHRIRKKRADFHIAFDVIKADPVPASLPFEDFDVSAGLEDLQGAGSRTVSHAERGVFGVDGCAFGFRAFRSTCRTEDARERYRNKDCLLYTSPSPRDS